MSTNPKPLSYKMIFSGDLNGSRKLSREEVRVSVTLVEGTGGSSFRFTVCSSITDLIVSVRFQKIWNYS